ncbi:MAG: hypothetical protein WAW61_04755 [Methylococcaceae bacterium]
MSTKNGIPEKQLRVNLVIPIMATTPIHDIVAPDAINLLAERLITPLQICHYLTLALIKGSTTGTKPASRYKPG